MTNQITATYVDHMGSDLSVVNAARVSFGKKSALEEPFEDCDVSLLRLNKGDTKLIQYLASHGHTSPFGHAFASFHCKSPLYVHAQLVKHKFLRVNTISRRYTTENIEFYTPAVWRGKSADKKQGSEGVVHTNADPDFVNHTALRTYNEMLADGVAPEMARMVLPQSTMTEFYWSGSLDAFASMCKLRCEPDTQVETQDVAWKIYHQMEDLFPVSWVALMEDMY
jgi:thymidylate synthase (FAD)